VPPLASMPSSEEMATLYLGWDCMLRQALSMLRVRGHGLQCTQQLLRCIFGVHYNMLLLRCTGTLAIWRAGCIAVPLATSHPPPELDYVLQDAGISLVCWGCRIA
jgi:hypothetical protein